MTPENYVASWKLLLLGTLTLVICGALIFAGAAGCKAYDRAQKRADASNEVKLTHIRIAQAQQQARINRAQIAATKAEAQKRIVEAHGIRAAQDLIAKTLTPLYVQHEAIQAQKLNGAGDRTYIPVGPQGVPLVANVVDPSLENPGGQ